MDRVRGISLFTVIVVVSSKAGNHSERFDKSGSAEINQVDTSTLEKRLPDLMIKDKSIEGFGFSVNEPLESEKVIHKPTKNSRFKNGEYTFDLKVRVRQRSPMIPKKND